MSTTAFLAALFPLLITWLVGLASPGPDLFVVLYRSLAGARREGIAAALGISTSVMFYLILGFSGLGFLLRSVPWIALVLQIGGGLVLLWMAWTALRGWINTREQPNDPRWDAAEGSGPAGPRELGFAGSWWRGTVTNLANPKFLIYITAVFSPFIAVERPVWHTVVLIALLVAMALIWFSLIALIAGAARLRHKLEGALVHLDVVAAVVFAGMGSWFVGRAVVGLVVE